MDQSKLVAVALPAAVFLLLFALETRGALREVPRRARHLAKNLALGAVNLPLHVASGAGTAALAALCELRGLGLLRWLGAPPALSLALGAALLDLTDYWFHRLEHRLLLPWRFHRVHHSDPAVDLSTSLRTHPGALVLHWLYQGVFIALLGVPFGAISLYYTILVAVSHWQHANVDALPPALERAMRWLVNTPPVHRLHHSRSREEAGVNFSDVLSLWDRLFGTYRDPGREVAFGLYGHDADSEQAVARLLTSPLRPDVEEPREAARAA
jgi:sterol desaturase/sphingolipid hydroxylase (fatty acid hydroxylase superfamily)